MVFSRFLLLWAENKKNEKTKTPSFNAVPGNEFQKKFFACAHRPYSAIPHDLGGPMLRLRGSEESEGLHWCWWWGVHDPRPLDQCQICSASTPRSPLQFLQSRGGTWGQSHWRWLGCVSQGLLVDDSPRHGHHVQNRWDGHLEAQCHSLSLGRRTSPIGCHLRKKSLLIASVGRKKTSSLTPPNQNWRTTSKVACLQRTMKSIVLGNLRLVMYLFRFGSASCRCSCVCLRGLHPPPCWDLYTTSVTPMCIWFCHCLSWWGVVAGSDSQRRSCTPESAWGEGGQGTWRQDP